MVSRGTLKFLESGKDEIRFIWDRNEGKLWLDLNRNGDLSDDPSGMFASPLTRRSGDSRNHAEFKAIPVTYNLPEGRAKGLMDLTLMAYGEQINTTVNWRSCWLGKARFQGRDWQVGILPRLGPNQGSRVMQDLLLRPWERQAEPFLVGEGSAETMVFPENVFLGQEGYRLTRKFESQDGAIQASLVARSFFDGTCGGGLDRPAHPAFDHRAARSGAHRRAG